MVNSFKEVSRGISPAELEQYADGIYRMGELADQLFSEGKLPKRFTPEPSRLDPFLEGKVSRGTLVIGGVGKLALLSEIGQRPADPVNFGANARFMVESGAFTTLPEPTLIEIIIAQVKDLAVRKTGDYATTREIWARRDELGLGPVSAETALHYLLQKSNQIRLGETLFMSMDPITDRDGDPRVFYLARLEDGVWLDDAWAYPDRMWDPDRQFVFSLRKPETQNT